MSASDSGSSIFSAVQERKSTNSAERTETNGIGIAHTGSGRTPAPEAGKR